MTIRNRFLQTALFLLLATSAAAQPARVVDRPEVPFAGASSGPGEAAEIDGVLYFSAFHPLTGRELWRFDGGGEPALVADICPGRESSDPRQPTAFDGRLYFLAESDCAFETGALWSTDGTGEGTVLLTSVGGPPGGQLAAAGGDLYFTAAGFTPLWVLRGSSLVELAPAASALTPLGDRLFFAGEDDRGQEPWVSDGTVDGTRRLRDIASGLEDSLSFALDPFFVRDGVAYFVAEEFGDCGFWRSDGTEDGTWELADLPPESFCGPTDEVAAVGDVFVFSGPSDLGRRLWRTDGTAAGTRTLGPPNAASPLQLTAVGEKVFFVRHIDFDTAELWWTDGTEEGTRQVEGLDVPDGLTSFGGRLLVAAKNLLVLGPRPEPLKLWTTDGTAEGTRLLADVRLGTVGKEPWAPFGDRLAFTGIRDNVGSELWITDGTSKGTRLAFDLVPTVESLEPRQLRALDGKPATVAFLGAGRLWAATAGGVTALTAPGDEPSQPTLAGGHLFFANAAGELLRTDVRSGAVELLAELDCEPMGLTAYGDEVYFIDFQHNEGIHVLYRTSGGPPQRVAAVRDLGVVPVGPSGSPPPPCGRSFEASRLGGDLVLSSRFQLVASDGTEAGTRTLFADTCGDFSCLFGAMAAVGDAFYVLVSPGEGLELWRALDDRSYHVVASFADSGAEPFPWIPLLQSQLVVWGEAVVFALDAAGVGEELWIADASGARLLADLQPGPGSSRPRDLVVHGGRLFFTADTAAIGRELRVAEDTGEVHVVRDLRPGPPSAFPGQVGPSPFLPQPPPRLLAPAGDVLLFAADDGERGAELWRTDATAEGTWRVQDLVPGARGSSPRDMTVAAGRVFWNAGTAGGGFELWTLPRSALAEKPEEPEEPSCPADTACQRDGRFTVTVRYRNQHASPPTEGVGHPLPLTDETSLFWFFSPENVELVVKVLDGRRINGHFWVFYGGLSDVEYWITVTDTETGVESVYHNPPGEICGQGDTRAFAAAEPDP